MTYSHYKNRLISLSLIASQLGVIPFAHAASLATAETKLLTDAMVASSQNLSKDELNQKVGEALHTYDVSAPKDGREDRMVDALVSMKFMTREHAENFRHSIDSSVPQGAAQTDMVADALKSALGNAQGAQFTSCEFAVGVMVAGAMTAIAGYALGNYNPTCYTSSGPTALGGGSTECAMKYYPEASQGKSLELGGGVALGLGAIIYAVSSSQGCR